MDFHKLARRDLQALCKMNQIPANVTNIAMADALASLHRVEGLDEFLNPREHDVCQSPETEKPPTPVITRSMTRASTRSRTAVVAESEQLQSRTTTRLTMRNRNTTAAVADKECKVLNFAESPAVSRTKKRTESASVKLKKVKEKVQVEKNEEGDFHADGTVNTVEKTWQGNTRASVTQSTRIYTRRSTRLLEKKMNDLKLSDEVTRDLEPIKMSDLAAEKDLTEDFEDAIKDEHPSERVKEDHKAEIVACVVEAPTETGSKTEAEGESESEEISKMSETKAAESEVDVTPVEVESDGNNLDSQLIANVQGKVSNEHIKEAEAENEIYDKTVVGVFANEVEPQVVVVSEIEEETECHLTEIYIKKKIIVTESDLDTPVEVENDSKTLGSQVIANIQDEKIDEVDESLVEHLQEGLTSVEEAANGYGYVALTMHVALPNGNGIPELTAQVTSLNLNCLKGDSKDMDSGEAEITAVPGDNDVMLDGYLADSDTVSELTMNVESLNGDGKLEICVVPLSNQPNSPIANSAAKMEPCNNVGQLFNTDVTISEFAMENSQNQKSVETVDVQIAKEACEIVKDSYIISAGDSQVKLPEEYIFSMKTPASIKKARKVPLSPPLVSQPTELTNPLETSSKKMQLTDENKENVSEGVEFGKKNITGLPVTDEDIQEPTLTEKSLRQLKQLVKKKIQMQNDKRHVLQMLPENNSMAVVGEKDD